MGQIVGANSAQIMVLLAGALHSLWIWPFVNRLNKWDIKCKSASELHLFSRDSLASLLPLSFYAKLGNPSLTGAPRLTHKYQSPSSKKAYLLKF